MCIHLHFPKLNNICHFSDHLTNLSMSSCKFCLSPISLTFLNSLSPVYTTQSTPPAINVIDDRRLWRSALLVACVFTLGDVARKWLGVTMRRSVVAGTRPWLLRRNMLGAWMVDANFIFILVSISSYVSFSLTCIRLFHPRLCMVCFFTSLLIFIMFIRPIYL